MEFLTELWLPILLSAVFVFIASSVLHMVLPWHKGDYRGLPGEDRLREAIGAEKIRPGVYMFPHANSMKEAGSPEMIEKFNAGPVGMMTVLPNGTINMGKTLVMWFVYTIVIGIFVGYIGWLGLGPGADYSSVFRLLGGVAVLGYAGSTAVVSIWKGVPCSITFRNLVDGVIYGLLTGGTFGWLWPELG